MLRSARLVPLCVLVVALAASGGLARASVSLSVESVGGVQRLWAEVVRADGSVERSLIRESAATIGPGASGADPAGLAVFATWTENGTQRWSSYSRDAGRSWSQGRPTPMTLRLHDGAVEPGRPMPAAAGGLGLGADARLYIVQLRTVSLPEWRAALAGAGAEPLRFFPFNAHIVRMSPGAVSQVERLDFVERVEPYHPSYRLEAELRDWLAGAPVTGAFDDRGRLRVNVMAFEWGPRGKTRILGASEPFGASTADYFPSGHVLELWVDRDALRHVAALDDVQWIDRWMPFESDMDIGRQDAGADWLEGNFGYCGDGVAGEVLDGGTEETHQDFDGILVHGSNSSSSHGTNTYGIVFGNGARDGDGQAQATGFLPCSGAQGIAADYAFLVDRFAHTQELKNDPYYASFQTNSWGSSRTTQYTSISSEMDDIIWRLDIAITQSQSNAGNQNSRPQAWAKNIISVGGIRHYNTLDTSDDAWSSGASIGPAADGRIKPDLHYYYDSIYTTTSGNGYTSGFGGTSGATPMVAGVLGLFVQMWSDNVWNTDPQGATVFERQPHFATIKALLVNNAFQYTFTGTTSDLTRTHQGWGRPNVQTAKERAANSLVIDQSVALSVGNSTTYDVLVQAGEPELKVTMIYPDPPGTTSSTLHRINDVDLVVTAPDGTTYYGNNGLDAGNYSTPGGSPNSVDTVENVFVQNPQAGVWTVRVDAVEVNQDGWLETPGDDVAFALVVTGANADAVCGNGVREFDEQCDGADLGTATCSSRGCSGGGVLGCNTDCTFDTSGCSGCPVCGDGTCDPGEDCLTCGPDCISQSSQVCGNGICEAADGENCLTCPADCNGVQKGKPADRYCCGDGGGENPVDCTDGRCTSVGISCVQTPQFGYCCGDTVCEGAEDVPICGVDCAPPTPGEAAVPSGGMMTVTGYDRATDTLTVSYGTACSATDHVIEYGELTRAGLESYAWSGQECGLGASGVHDWSMAGTPDSLFFVIVGTDAVAAGSYGRDSLGVERPEDVTSTTCPLPQDLGNRCD